MRRASCKVGGGYVEQGTWMKRESRHTVKLPKHAVHGAGAAATAHADVEFVGVFCGHGCDYCLSICGFRRLRLR